MAVDKIKAICQAWLDKQGHDRCWYYPELFKQLCEILELKPTQEPALPPRAEFEAGCRRYTNEEFGASGTTEQEKYQGYSWIKVKRSKPVEIEGCSYVTEGHHVQETTFLIDKIRELALRIDELKASTTGL